MANHHDSISLHWVRGEIQETLKQAQKALEAYADDREDTSRLRFCLNHLHQVHGTLRMVELFGAALVAEEMERLAEAILAETVDEADQAISSLMQGILQLPEYLATLKSSVDDVPLALLPLLNDLRAARNEPFLSASSLFNPDLSPARFTPDPKVEQRLQDDKVLANVRKLYQMFQFARSGLERDVDVEAHLDYLDKVMVRLIKLCQKTPQGELWLAAGAFLDTLRSGQNELGAATNHMIGELDHQAKRLIDEHEHVLSEPAPEDVLKNLLYYVARGAGADSERVRTVIERYQLGNALPGDEEAEQGQHFGPNREAMRSVISALTEELASVKDQLDLFVRGTTRDPQELEELVPVLNQIANTLSMLGQGGPRQVILDQAELVNRLAAEQTAPDDGTLMDIAGALLYVEATLSGLEDQRGVPEADAGDDGEGHYSPRHVTDASDAVLRESRNALEQVKTAIVNFIASQWDREEIRQVPELIHSIRGSLALIPLEHTASMLESCERFVRDALLNEQYVPDWSQLDTLADAITSIEYYLERLADGIEDNEAILTMAEESLEELGFPVGAEPTWQIPVVDEAATAADAQPAAQPEPKQSDADLLDDDILEIFVEEADEVLEAIREHYPAVRENYEDHHALSEVRRAFHTLKGSGRLVGATSIGELAWSVENLLNRVLDRTITPGESMFSLLDRVIDRLPRLIQEFRDGNMTGDIAALMEEANAIVDAHKPGVATEDEAESEIDAGQADIEEVDDEPEQTTETEPPTEEPEHEGETVEAAAPPEEPAPVEPEPTEAASEADDDSLVDDEIVEIFIEEAEEVLETIGEFLPQLLAQYDNASALAEIRRAFHTLKGSGRMVEAHTIGELAWTVENALNRVIEGQIFMSDDMARLLEDVTAAIPDLVDDFRHRRATSRDTATLEARANALAKGEILDAEPMPAGAAESTSETEKTTEAKEEPQATPQSSEALTEAGLDPVLLDIFRSETSTHLQTLNDFIAEGERKDTTPYTDDLSRALHTLKGSAHTAGIDPIATVATPIEKFIKHARAEGQQASPEVIDLLRQLRDFVEQGLEQIDSSPQAELPGTHEFLDRLTEAWRQHLPEDTGVSEATGVASDMDLLQLFLNEGIDQLLDADDILDSWLQEPTDTAGLEQLAESLGTLASNAAKANVTDVEDLSAALASLYTEARQSPEAPGESMTGLAHEGHEALINLMDQLAAGLATEPQRTLVNRLSEQAADLRQLRAEAQEKAFNDRFGEDLDTIDQSLSDDLELGEVDWDDELGAIDETTATEPESADQPAEEAEQASGPEESETPEEAEARTAEQTGTAVTLDPEMAEIFLEEARDLISSTAEVLEQWRQAPEQTDPLRQLQRDIHTLKGGAGLAEITPIRELSHEMENLLEGVTEGYLSGGEALGDLLTRAQDALAEMVDTVGEQSQCHAAPELMDAIRQYREDARQEVPVTQVTDVEESAAETDSAEEEGEEATETPEQESEDSVAHTEEESAPVETETTSADLDPELAEIFLEEAHELVDSTGAALHDWVENPGDTELAKTLQRDLHTLKGGARMAEVSAIGDLSHHLEDLFERVAEGRLQLGENTGDLLFACHDALARMVEQVSELKPCEDPEKLIQRVDALIKGEAASAPKAEPETQAQAEPEDADHEGETLEQPKPQTTAEASDEQELISIFLDEARDVEDAIREALESWKAHPETADSIAPMREELNTLKGGARLATQNVVAELADEWDSVLASVIDGAGSDDQALALSEKCHQALRDMLQALETGQSPEMPPGLFDHHREESTEETGELLGDVDPEVLEIFLEEAGELVDSLDNTLAAWGKAPAEEGESFSQEAQRALHTIKGGARLAELSALGDKAHEFESLLIALEQEDKQPQEDDWNRITTLHDEIISMVERVQQAYQQKISGEEPTPAPEQQATEAPETPAPDESKESGEAASATQPPAVAEPDSAPVEQAKPPAHGARARDKRKAELTRSQQETVRVNAQLVDDLVNLAGETSITRGRMESQISDFSHTLDEMAATTERLREQLRRMEIETEAQIVFRAEQELGPDYDQDFDPLEMDRYSGIQQLSRALTESASDLVDLRETMAEKVRDAETLLLQQSRTNTELQEGLMKTRMVPFSSMVPRLRRIVRQISGELEKKVHFDVNNAEGELDRTVLERMVAPLEHMLRNAIDHGIESADQRRKSKKPKTGHVTLDLTREGGEVVLRLQDDGAGISIEKVREKAIRQGLLGKNEHLSDREILQFILQPGFSTAQAVTQISGRGVGMDVVASEIKQLGGSLDIDSSFGHGTTFTVRLPFTVSVNRALMVTIGEDYYAIPLNTIEGIVRVSTYELEEYYQPDAPLYEYAGEQYRLQYLGALLNSEHQPKLQGQALPLPVILVRGAEQPMALQVDSLMGSREIVVKSLGPQFASVRGVSGATILGDGNVVVILDLPAMIRGDILAQRQRMLATVDTRETPRDQRPTTVMVVDDSVTVRKVTSRLLERHGMEVLLAKDGLDAVGQLQDHRPDVVLLDIEMPRMDGFEVASFIRHDEGLKDVPIIMITSRTGDKHKDRATAIGVNRYLGKPFQEKELLDTIMEMAGVEA